MRAAIHDKSLLQTLRPLDLTTYLKAHGWALEAEQRERGSVWVWREEHGSHEFDLVVPANRQFADYSLRIGEVLSTLAEAEGRSELDIVRDLQSATSDLLRLRATHPDAETGTLPLDMAVSFVERSRDMMLAAACAAIATRSVYGRRKPQLAMNYLNHVRMGQTEQGSFVLTILSPVAPELRPAQGDLIPVEPQPPYERMVTQTLMKGLAALSNAAGSAAIQADMQPFRDGVDAGVSANLCDAVAGLAAVSPGRALDVAMTWASHRPTAGAAPNRVTFESDSIPVIEEAARQFRETEPIEDVEVEGLVTRLDRDPTAPEGEVTVTGNVDGQMLKVGISLGPDEYSRAVRAHDNRQPVRFTGELVKEGRGHKLRNPRHFDLVQVADEN